MIQSTEVLTNLAPDDRGTFGSLCGRKRKPRHSTFLCELLSFAEEAVEDGAEVGEQPLAVLQQLQGLRVCEVGRAVEQWRTCTTDTTQMPKN